MKKRIINLIYPILFILILNNNLFAQLGEGNYLLPDGLGLSNQLEYSYDVDLERQVLENWFNLDYSKGIFSSGLRFDIFEPAFRFVWRTRKCRPWSGRNLKTIV